MATERRRERRRESALVLAQVVEEAVAVDLNVTKVQAWNRLSSTSRGSLAAAERGCTKDQGHDGPFIWE
jgi:hypothetical protein